MNMTKRGMCLMGTAMMFPIIFRTNKQTNKVLLVNFDLI